MNSSLVLAPRSCLLACILSWFVLFPTHGALVNGGFEESWNGWTHSSGAYTQPQASPPEYVPYAHGGSRVLKLEVPPGNSGIVAYVSQSLLAAPGDTFTFSAYMMNYSGYAMRPGSYASLEMLFQGPFGTQTIVSPQYFPPESTTGSSQDWSFANLSGVAPAGTESVVVFLKLTQVNTDAYGGVWFDDASLSVVSAVPEPLTPWLSLGTILA